MKIHFMDTQIYTFNTPKTVIIYLKRKWLNRRRGNGGRDRAREHLRIYVYLNVLKFRIARFRSHFQSLFFADASCSSRTHKHAGSILKVNTQKFFDEKFIISHDIISFLHMKFFCIHVTIWIVNLFFIFIPPFHFRFFFLFILSVGFLFISFSYIKKRIYIKRKTKEGGKNAYTHTRAHNWGRYEKTQASKYSLIQCRQLVHQHSVCTYVFLQRRRRRKKTTNMNTINFWKFTARKCSVR